MSTTDTLTITEATVTAATPDEPSRVQLRLSRELDDFELVEARKVSQTGQATLFEIAEDDRLVIRSVWSAFGPKFWLEQVEGIRSRAAAARSQSDADTLRAQEIANDINAAL